MDSSDEDDRDKLRRAGVPVDTLYCKMCGADLSGPLSSYVFYRNQENDVDIVLCIPCSIKADNAAGNN